MNLQKQGKIDKGWGYEIVWSNNEKYSAKLLVFDREGAKTSLVFHKNRKKSWFVNAGKFKLTYIDISSGEIKQATIEEGQTIDFGEMSPHQLESMAPGSVIFEVGTPDYLEDRFRLSPGDTQRLSVKPESNQTS